METRWYCYLTILHREFVPTPIEHHITLVSGKRFLEAAVVVALQVGEVTTALIIPKRIRVREELELYIYHELISERTRHVRAMVDRPWRLYNQTAGTWIDTHQDFTVGDAIVSGDLLRVEHQKSKPSEESRPTIRITPEDLEGRHNP